MVVILPIIQGLIDCGEEVWLQARSPVQQELAQLIDGLAGINAPGELMNGQIGPLPRTVHGEITKRYDTHLVEVRIGRAKEFARDFRRAVRTECLSEMLILRKWDRFRSSVNR